MNLVLLGAADFVEAERVRLRGRRHIHLVEVLRVAVGAEVRVGMLDDRIGQGRVRAIDAESVELDVLLDRDPPPPTPVTLLLALPRPKSVPRILQGVVAMGVKRVVLMASWKVEKSYWDSPVVHATALREQAILGLEQAGDTMLPRIEVRSRFKPFVEDELPAVVAGTRGLVAHPTAPGECPRHMDGAVTLAIGPEGGFTDYEVAMLAAHGCEPVSLGPRRLRVEQVVPALLGRLF